MLLDLNRKGRNMKSLAVILLVLLSLLIAQVACAEVDSLDRIERYVADNSAAKVYAEVVQKYCTCMSNKMGSGFSMTISDWEKSHLKEREECDVYAEWMTR